jgi:hypothetical protein
MALLSTGQSSVITTVDHTYSHTIKLVRNDTLPEINLTLIDETTEDPIDLTNATSIVLKFREENSSTVKTTIPMYTVAPATSGAVYMQWPVGALDTAGIFTGEIEITYSSGGIQTVFSELKFEVREDY